MPRGHRRNVTQIFKPETAYPIVPPPPIKTPAEAPVSEESSALGRRPRGGTVCSYEETLEQNYPPAKRARKIANPEQRAAEEDADPEDLGNAISGMQISNHGHSVTFGFPGILSPDPLRPPEIKQSESMQSSSSTGSVTGPFGTASSINRPGTPFPTNEATPGYSPPPSEFTEESASIAIEVDEASTLGDSAG